LEIIEFENQEQSYLRWLSDHPSGYVLNTYKKFRPQYARLHSASCVIMRLYMRHMVPDAFTCSEFKKVCSGSRADLELWATARGYSAPQVCRRCLAAGQH